MGRRASGRGLHRRRRGRNACSGERDACASFGASTFVIPPRHEPCESVLVGSARWLVERLRPVRAQRRRHGVVGSLDEPADRHPGSVEDVAGTGRPGCGSSFENPCGGRTVPALERSIAVGWPLPLPDRHTAIPPWTPRAHSALPRPRPPEPLAPAQSWRAISTPLGAFEHRRAIQL